MICKKLTISALCTFVLSFSIYAQTTISGIINTYTKVTAVDTCKNTLTVLNKTAFIKGEEVLLIQMKGAVINEGQSSVYGNLVNQKSAGLYEINTIDSIVLNIIYLKNKFINTYQSDASLQLVTIPKFQNATVSDTLKAKNWDGTVGGILIFRVENELTLSSYIDVSGKGFRGGTGNPNPDPNNSCTWFLTIGDYVVNKGSWRGAEKGEGLAEFTVGKEAARGAQLNGGGGGNDHNSGGGGGANITKGGIGGTTEEASQFSCKGPNPGIGGKALPSLPSRIYLGGGGGAGHGNNAVATSGGNGGGIMIILAKKVIGTGTKILSNGSNAKNTSGDGAGGGGAGGTIILDVEETIGNINIQAKGGNGGVNTNNGSASCFGPGGGGSGGRAITTSNIPFTFDLIGGVNGTSQNPSCGNSANGAQKGDDGVKEFNQYLPFAKQKIALATITKQPDSDTLCLGKLATIKIETQGVGLKYQWQLDAGAGFQNLSDNLVYGGTNTNILIVKNPFNGLNLTKLKCIITSICGDKIFSKPINIILREQPKASFTYVKTGAFYSFINNSQSGVTYKWDFGDGAFSTEKNPSHLYTQDGDFTIDLATYGECGIAFSEQKILIVTPPKAAFKADTLTGCAPFVVKFKNLSSQNSKTYNWTFEGADIASSSVSEPSVTYLKSGIYGVTLEAANTQFQDVSAKNAYIVIYEKPNTNFVVKSQTEKTVSFENKTTNGQNFTWNFGDGISDFAKNPTHTYLKDGEYTVTLTATNDCGSKTYVQNIKVFSVPKAQFSASVKMGCLPLVVQFSDLTTQTLTQRKWSFQGAKQDTSSQKNPTVVYDKVGVFPVKLYVTNSSGKDSLVAQNYIQVFDKAKLDFDLVIDKLNVKTQNFTTNASTYTWSIESTTIASKDKDFTFNLLKSGTYKIKLSATNQCGTASLIKEITVTNQLPCEQIEVNAFPNPTTYYANIQFNAARKEKNPYIWTTIDGRVIARGDLDGETINKEIDLQTLPSGIYIFYVKCENKIFVKKIVKNAGE
jgi:PKD repeat protein